MSDAHLVPVVQELVPPPDPAGCCEALSGWPYRLFLDSAARGSRLGRYSFVAADPSAVIRSKAGHTEHLDLRAGTSRRVPGDAMNAVRSLLAGSVIDAAPGLPPFQGGAAGYLAYDWSRSLERVPAPRFDDLGLPDLIVGAYDWVLAWDHAVSRAWLISTGLGATPGETPRRRAAERARVVMGLLQGRTTAETAAPRQVRTPPPGAAASFPVTPAGWSADVGLRSSFTHAGYLDAVAHAREYIRAGDIFQVNLSQRFEAPLIGSPWSFYRRLRTRNAAPFAAFLDFPDATVLSASPERFLRVDGDGHVETRPIKGTRPRGAGPEHDAALGQALAESAKDRAENLMIVDLMRNDLSRVCTPGTVRVPELFALERYATVHHLVSTVVGDLAPGADALDLLRAAFPGGSITGAPKVRAMEIIAEVEPSQRGVYCGSIGYWSLTGELDTSVAIRTAVAIGDRLYFSAGGGIVADSDPEQEYRETIDKARGIIEALEVGA